MSIKVIPKITPEGELNALLKAIPINHPAKNEVSGILASLDNLKRGLQPNGSQYPPGQGGSVGDNISKFTMETLINKGFSIALGKNANAQSNAVKNFLISAVKNGERMDVGSLVSSFLPEDAKKLLSKVLQADIVGKDIFQIKDIALKRVQEVKKHIENLLKLLNGDFSKIKGIYDIFGELPEVAMAAAAVEEIQGFATELMDTFEALEETMTDKLKDMEAVFESGGEPDPEETTTTPSPDNTTTTTTTTTTKAPEPSDAPKPPKSIEDAPLPKPFEPEDETEYVVEEEEEEGIIFDA